MMNSIFSNTCFKTAIIAVLLAVSANSCVYVNEDLGTNLIPADQLYDIYVDTLYLNDVRMADIDSISGYSSIRITVGAIQDDFFGLSRKSSCFNLIPVNDSLDFGKNTVIKGMHFNASKDTLSYIEESHKNILQGIKAYKLEKEGVSQKDIWKELAFTSDIKSSEFINRKLISKGIPVYNGGDSLAFDFTDEFTREFVDSIKTFKKEDGICVFDSIGLYNERVPGIYLTSDSPIGKGGRINMFKTPVDQEDGTVYGSYAELKFTADYGDRTKVDTSFLFLFGAVSFVENQNIPNQYALNFTEIERNGLVINDDKTMHIEGGTGSKPVISATEMRDKLKALFESRGVSRHQDVIINKASLILPYKMPEKWTDMNFYPDILNPTTRVATDTSLVYASITDASVSSENQGNIDKSNLCYKPDISYHIQELIKLDDLSIIDRFDLWMFILKSETITKNNTSSSNNDYYNQLMMAQYYNQLMYGGYGGYGGYGYGGYGYGGYGGYGYGSNYYNYYLMNALYGSQSSSSSQSETTTIIDTDRYYNAALHGPAAEKESERPRLVVVYSVPKNQD